MSRHARPVFPKVPMHIVQRGNNKNPCFFSRKDYKLYTTMLQEAAALSGCQIHAYALMPNHVHILASPTDETAPAQMMKALGQRYTQYINRTYNRFGTLWQGRYRSSIVGEDRYFLVCHRYIELNPVRAGIIRHPADYEWSSYRTNAFASESEMIVPHETYLRLATNASDRTAAYRDLFRDEISEPTLEHLRSAINTNFAFGSAEFVDQFRRETCRDSIRRFPSR